MLLKNFTLISKSDVLEAGGKGASLGEMTQVGIPVPPGFVVLASAFDRFLEETDLNVKIDSILHQVNHKEVHTTENASEKIKALILSAQMPEDIAIEITKEFRKLDCKYVAVRSSATAEDSASAAWAGQLESYLNTTEENLLKNVQKCWVSLFTPRAIHYRFDKDLHEHKISVAVVIQKMIQSEASGIAFSVHPVTQDYNQIIIEAGYGLGEAIVSGQITPDSYVVEKTNYKILDKNVSVQNKALMKKENNNEWVDIDGVNQKLTDEEIVDLSKIIVKIENHYGFPVDIEWAKEKDEFYIVQSRPITTLSNTTQPDLDISDYQRLFELHGLNVDLLTSDIFVGHYKTLSVLLTYKGGDWTTYLPLSVVKQTLADGVKMFGNKEVFDKYQSEFADYIKSYTFLLENLASRERVTEEETKEVLDLASKFFYFYSKTEFFYTDQAFIESANSAVLKENLSKLEQIKNSGREGLNKFFLGKDSLVYNFLKVLAKQLNLNPELLFAYYTKQEILDLFKNKTIEESVIQSRKLGYLITSDRGEMTLKTGLDAVGTIEKIHNKLLTRINSGYELKGTPANKGKVRGRVKVIPSDYYRDWSKLKHYFAEMKKGDILVAETTSPELMPACEKASAIITNQGGLLSHAAIVSREMNIPCIVGTGNATEVLKDGDLVEVDANKAVIRILK